MMVTPIDAVRYGMGFDETGHWHEAAPRFIPVRRSYSGEDPLAPARGAIWGILAGAGLWVGLFAAAHTLFGLF